MVFRKDVNGLRAWAVVLVVFFHFGVRFFDGGFLGVDIFFVISGFLMVGIIVRRLETVSAKQIPLEIFKFYLARARRILPALLLLSSVLMVLGWLYLSPVRYEFLGKQVAAAVVFVSNNLFLRESGYFDVSSHQKIMLHTWSLSVEWQFYIALPIVMSVVWKLRPGRRAQLFSMIAICVASFCYCLYLSRLDPSRAFYLTLSRAWEMLVGGIVFFLFCEKRKEIKGLTTLGFLIIICSALMMDSKSTWPSIYTIFPVIATGIIIYSGANSFWTSGRFSQYFGSRSYSIYLWHWPLVVGIGFLDLQNSNVALIFGVLLTLVFAEISYRLVERVASASFLPTDNKIKFVASIVVILAVVMVGNVIRKSNGYPNRLPASVLQLASYKFSYGDYRMGQCFLRPEQAFNSFGDCVDGSVSSSSKTILLWGDSHAAHLYPGIVKNFPENERLAQFTASGCPPFLDVTIEERRNCKDINKFVVNWIKNNHPDEVILSARWSAYDWRALRKTLEFLNGEGIKNIVIFGPAPIWNGILSDILLNNSLINGDDIPDRESRYLIVDDEVEKGIKDISLRYHSKYVSVKDVLCDSSGCMTHLNTASGPVPMAWDEAHLSSPASDYLISKSRIFELTSDAGTIHDSRATK